MLCTFNHVTPNGSGLERYNVLVRGLSGAASLDGMLSLMESAYFSNAYKGSAHYAQPRWDTEFVGYGRTVDTPTEGYDQVQEIAAQKYAERTRSHPELW